MDNQAWLEVDGVTIFRNRKPVLVDLTFKIPNAVQRLYIVGPSGVGKTTLLHTISGFLLSYDGRIFLDKERVTRPTGTAPIVFQDQSLWNWMTALENVRFSIQSSRRIKNVTREQCLVFLDKVRIAHKADAYPLTMSIGEQQRLSIARAISAEPKHLFLDEPFSALDPSNQKGILQDIQEWLQLPTRSMIMVSHNIHQATQEAEMILHLQNAHEFKLFDLREMTVKQKRQLLKLLEGDE